MYCGQLSECTYIIQIMKLSLAFLIVSLFGVSKGGYFWKSCREIKQGKEVDHRLILGNWYVLGVSPGRWSKCYKYSITVDENNDYYMRENYLSVTHAKSENTYNLRYVYHSPEFTIARRYWEHLPLWETWTVISADSTYQRYMLLYKCGWIFEESQIWIRDSNFTTDSSRASDEILTAIRALGFEEDDYEFKKSWECFE